jgi:chromosome segregation ATPase
MDFKKINEEAFKKLDLASAIEEIKKAYNAIDNITEKSATVIKSLQVSVNTLNETIKTNVLTINEKNREIAKLKQDIVTLEARIISDSSKKQPPVSDVKDDSEIGILKSENTKAETEKNQLIATKDKQIASKDQQISILSNEKTEAQKKLAEIQAEANNQKKLAEIQAEANNQNQWQIPLASGLAGLALGGFLGYNLKPKKKKHRDMSDINSELI